MFKYIDGSFRPTYGENVCRATLWPEGEAYGHPYRIDVDGTDFQPHMTDRLFPYGGSTYALSRGMLNVVGKENWKHYMDAFRCRGGDLMTMYLVLNFGYSITHVDFGAVHHVRDPVISLKRSFKFLRREDQARICLFYFTRQHEIVLHPATSNDTIGHFMYLCEKLNINQANFIPVAIAKGEEEVDWREIDGAVDKKEPKHQKIKKPTKSMTTWLYQKLLALITGQK